MVSTLKLMSLMIWNIFAEFVKLGRKESWGSLRINAVSLHDQIECSPVWVRLFVCLGFVGFEDQRAPFQLAPITCNLFRKIICKILIKTTSVGKFYNEAKTSAC